MGDTVKFRRSPKADDMTMTDKKTPRGRGKILVMDDEKVIREVLRQMLSHLGYSLTLSKDGAEAIGAYRNAMDSGEPYRLAILDLTVSKGLGGRETFRKLLKIDPVAKGIITSSYLFDPVMTNYKKYGFCGSLAKPYGVFELSNLLEKKLES